MKKGPAFERQRRKMAATTGSGEQGRRARPAEGPRARAGVQGLAEAIAVRPGPRRWICPPGSVAGTGRPASGGGAGGGRKHGRGPEGPVGGAVRPRSSPGRREGPAERQGRALWRCCAAGAGEWGAQGALPRSRGRRLFAGRSRGPLGAERLPKADGSPLLSAVGPGPRAALGCPCGRDVRAAGRDGWAEATGT